jgi:hypothetical protein
MDLDATWRIGQTNLGVFANIRGSFLVGRATDNTNYTQTVQDPLGRSNPGGIPVNTAVNPSATSSSDLTMPIVELELGMEYSSNWGRLRWFVRPAVVSQTYFGAGNASRLDGNLSLFGGKLSIGVAY